MNIIARIPFLPIFKSLICSSLNLLMYIIIALSILGFAQGYVIPIDLYLQNSPIELIVNLTLFHFLLYFMALIMSLYPTYVYSFIFEEESTKKYTSKKWGLIYYKIPNYNECLKTDEAHSSNAHTKNPKSFKLVEGLVRKFLAVLLFNVWSTMIVRVFCLHQIDPLQTTILYIFNTVLVLSTLYLFAYFGYRKKQEIKNSTDRKAQVESIINLVRYNRVLLGVLSSLLILSALFFGWHILTIVIDMLLCFSLSIEIILFRTYRKYLKPYCKIVNLLQYYRILGIITFSFLVAINCSVGFAEYINPLNIILGYLVALYTIIIMFFKIYLYLRYKNPNNQQNFIPLGFKFRIAHFTYFSIIGIIYIFVSFGYTSKIHHLESIKSSGGINLKDFYQKFITEHNPNNQPILYAAYGGGLKANYWNLLILDTLDQADKFRDIIAFSGVSGGGMGIGSYAALKYTNHSKQDKAEFYRSIRSSNILSIELSWLFGLDFLRDYIFPFGQIGKGRAKRSTRYYSKAFNKPSLSTYISFQEVHKSLFEQSYYPNILINSSSTKESYGVASAVHVESELPGAINILNLNNNCSISYLDAVSTCNRFPLISPAAHIKGKGQFLDGGYFENSGILSLYSFYNQLKKVYPHDSILNDTIKIVSVRNSKMSYLRSLLKNTRTTFEEINNSKLTQIPNKKDLFAIIDGGLSIERLPHVFKSILANDSSLPIRFLNIDLPYYIHTNKISRYLGGTIEPQTLEKITKVVEESNEEIEAILGNRQSQYKLKEWGVVNPPTARILSKPVELYMELMMQHSHVRRQIKSVIH